MFKVFQAAVRGPYKGTTAMNTRVSVILAAAALAAAGCERSNAPSNTSTGRPASTAPDNTARNKVDRDSTMKTPMDQSEVTSDVKITADIRRAIMDDKSMSTNAQNVKIVTQTGAVTLRGVVDTQAEKEAIEAKARGVAGVTSVDNQLEVKNP
jgi:hyperosmotically inducible protein